MKLKKRYIAEWYEDEVSQGRIGECIARIEGSKRLRRGASLRALLEWDERLLTLIACGFMALTFLFYYISWTVPGAVTGVLMLLLCFISALWTLVKRAILKYCEKEITPNRNIEQLFSKALGLKLKDRDVTWLYEEDEAERFFRRVRETVSELAEKAGIEPDSTGLRTDINISSLRENQTNSAVLPAVAQVTIADTRTGMSAEIIFEWSATFALAYTGDTMLASLSLQQADVLDRDTTLPEIRPYDIGFHTCAGCHRRFSDRYDAAKDGVCPVCGGRLGR